MLGKDFPDSQDDYFDSLRQTRADQLGKSVQISAGQNLTHQTTGLDSKDVYTDVVSRTFDPDSLAQKTGYFTGTHTHSSPDASSITPQDAMQQAYRDMAKQLHKGDVSLLQKLFPQVQGQGNIEYIRDLQSLPYVAQDRFGHSAAQEIAQRLATPDNLSTPATIAGASVGATQSPKSKK